VTKWPDKTGTVAPASRLITSASQEMKDEKDQAHDQRDMNETRRYVKCEKPKQPENNQNQGD
jgi:hypothetical protein